MAVELFSSDGTAEEETERVEFSSSSTAKGTADPEIASASEIMYERKRKHPAFRSKGFVSNGLAYSSHGHPEVRPGLCQLLVSEEVSDAHLPVRLSPTGLADATVPSYQSEVSADISPDRYVGPINETWHLPPLLDINEVSQRFAESASNLRRRFANLVEENVTRDIRRNLLEQLSGASMDGDPRMSLSEHERIHLSLASASTASSHSTEEVNIRLLESAHLLSNISVERAAALFSSTSAAMLEMGQHFVSLPPTVWSGIVTRIQTTLRGSVDDIGWLVNNPDYPAAEDGTEDFLRALEQIGRGIHVLPDNLTYLLVPGLFSNHGPLYFHDTKKHFAKLGLPCHIAKIHSELGVEKNAKEIKEYVEVLYKSTGRKVVMLGHSKGGVDAAAACSMFWDQLKGKVVGIILVQSPYGGSPIASDILREGQIADVETRRILEILICRIFKGDIKSLEDLTYEKRKEFLAKYSLPADLPVLSFHTEASRTPRAVSVMSHIGHAQLPWLPGIARRRNDQNSDDNEGSGKLHVAVPLAAAMAICALHLELRYKEKSDGLVTRKDAEVPGSIVVRPEKKLDHAWMVYAPSRREPNEPDAAQMCEALIALVLNHPRWRRCDVTCEAQVALQEADEASANASLAKSQDPNDFLTTDAARSFLADTEGVPEAETEESRRFLCDNSASETCASDFGSASERRVVDTCSISQDSDVGKRNAAAARTGLNELVCEGTSRVKVANTLDLQRRIPDMVMSETPALALREATNNASAVSDQRRESDIREEILPPSESSDADDISN
uniref:GPI inositol-deacylase n=1 Tax=Physcomitrium patens TaxID=3218 RepID=A0A7I4ALI0_PHYPA